MKLLALASDDKISSLVVEHQFLALPPEKSWPFVKRELMFNYNTYRSFSVVLVYSMLQLP